MGPWLPVAVGDGIFDFAVGDGIFDSAVGDGIFDAVLLSSATFYQLEYNFNGKEIRFILQSPFPLKNNV